MIVALIGQKGGAGKSTTAIALATEAHARGLAVLLVDADPQGTTSTWHAVATEAGHPTPTVVAMNGAMLHKPEQLPRMSESYDLVIVDCPPRHGDTMRSALMAADVALLPCGPSGADAWALTSSLDLVREAQQFARPQLRAAVVVTKKSKGTAAGKVAREVLAEGGFPVLRTELGYRVAFQNAITAGQGVTAFDRGDAALEVRRLLDEVITFASSEESHVAAAS